jgi:hypothetical protein
MYSERSQEMAAAGFGHVSGGSYEEPKTDRLTEIGYKPVFKKGYAPPSRSEKQRVEGVKRGEMLWRG